MWSISSRAPAVPCFGPLEIVLVSIFCFSPLPLLILTLAISQVQVPFEAARRDPPSFAPKNSPAYPPREWVGSVFHLSRPILSRSFTPFFLTCSCPNRESFTLLFFFWSFKPPKPWTSTFLNTFNNSHPSAPVPTVPNPVPMFFLRNFFHRTPPPSPPPRSIYDLLLNLFCPAKML